MLTNDFIIIQSIILYFFIIEQLRSLIYISLFFIIRHSCRKIDLFLLCLFYSFFSNKHHSRSIFNHTNKSIKHIQGLALQSEINCHTKIVFLTFVMSLIIFYDYNIVKICSKQTFMITSGNGQIKIWKYSTLVNLITVTYRYTAQINFIQLHPIDCRIFILADTTIFVLDGNNFSQIYTIHCSDYVNSIVFIPQKDVFYLGGDIRYKIDKYNANTYSLMTSMNIPSVMYKMDGYYNHQLRAAILVVSFGNNQLKVYNMETNSQLNITTNLTNFNYDPFSKKFSKSGKFLFTYNYANKCLIVFNLNQNKNSYLQFSKICNLSSNIIYPSKLISTAYSDDFAIIADHHTLKMVQLIQKKQFKVIDDYQLFNLDSDYILSMSQVNGIITVGTNYGNVFLVYANYPFIQWISVICGIAFFLVMVVIAVILRCRHKNQKQDKIKQKQKQKIPIEEFKIILKTEKKKQSQQGNYNINDTQLDLNQAVTNQISEEQRQTLQQKGLYLKKEEPHYK